MTVGLGGNCEGAMRRSVLAVGGAAAGLLLGAAPAFAWGSEAHRTVALIADKILQQSAPQVRAKVQQLLAGDKTNKWTKTDIAGEATWADVLRDKSEEARNATSPWHSTKLKPDNPDLDAACYGHTPLPPGYPASRGRPENCSIDKVEQFVKELEDPETLPGERLAALQFTLNLVADLHDPLYAIDRGDQSGRCLAVQIGSAAPVRLAALWESTLPRQAIGLNPAAAASHIFGTTKPEDAQKWAEGKPADWVRDSYEVAKSVVYGFGGEPAAGKHTFPASGKEKDSCGPVDLYKVAADYETKGLAALKIQLAKAGVRLAAVLRGSLK